ncbi:F-box/kelch-repeat protein At3g23880-like [Silene latifolia]|uniref:F-box/kelch-repeat protein At3g23880-like n=1 Tax=Silene latifolia TaxID=37657 RepID=UPI003D7725AE
MSMERKQHVGKRKKSKNSQNSIISSCSSSISIPKSHPNHSIQHKKPKSSHNNQMIISSNKSIDLPCIILIEILGRLPIQTLISCKFVCKSWRSLLTESYFYKLYTYHMPTTLILQIKGSSLNTLKQINYIESSSCSSNSTTTTTSLLKKLRFVKRVNNNNDNNQDLGYLNGPDFRFQLGNSCNGFVCIREIGTREPTLVWNPMMGQFAVLPKPANTSVDKVVAGFGFCGRTNKYKVLRIFHKNLDPQSKLRVEIYELGVGDKWRGIGDAPFPIPSRIPGFYTNNSIHWIMDDEFKPETANSELICGFDFIEEKFKVITPPPIYSSNQWNKYHWSNLGIIASCLSVCAIDAKIFRADVQVWVMEDYGVPESWNMKLSIRDPTVDWWDPHRWMQVTNYGNDGEILMLCAHGYLLAYSVRDREFRSVEGLKFPAIALAPSLISLEAVLCDQEGTGSLNVMYL